MENEDQWTPDESHFALDKWDQRAWERTIKYIEEETESRRERLDGICELAEVAFSEHELQEANQRSWFLKKPGTSVYWVEIVALRGNAILIHGDIGATIFQRWSGKPWPMGALRWVGRMVNSPGYAIEKAAYAGKDTHLGAEEVWDRDMAKRDIYHLIQRIKTDWIIDEWSLEEHKDTVIKLKKLLILGLDDLCPDEVSREIYEITRDGELCDVGRCIRARVVYAIYAVRKLLDILEE